jgi:hypothetical protein
VQPPIAFGGAAGYFHTFAAPILYTTEKAFRKNNTVFENASGNQIKARSPGSI